MLNNYLDFLIKEKKIINFQCDKLFWCCSNMYKHIQLLMLIVLSQLQKQNKWTRFTQYMFEINRAYFFFFVIDHGHFLKQHHECNMRLWCSLILSKGLVQLPCIIGGLISHHITQCEVVCGETFLCSLGTNASCTCHPAPCLLSSLAPDSQLSMT